MDRKAVVPMVIIVTVFAIAAGLLLAYNYARFGDPFEFGMKYAESMFKNYLFLAGNFARYEHIPLNLCDLCFFDCRSRLVSFRSSLCRSIY